jgi:hypothetical protein
MGTREFASTTGDTETAKTFGRRFGAVLSPGFILTAGGIITLGVSVGVMTAGLTVFILELIPCGLSLGRSCDFTASESLLEVAAVLFGVGATTGGVGLVLLGVGLAIVGPQMRLLNWYTPEQVRQRIDVYNRELAERLEVDEAAALGPTPTGGELVLEPTLAGVRLRAAF